MVEEQEEQKSLGQVGIGTREPEKLEAKPVSVVGYEVRSVPEKNQTDDAGNIKTEKGHYGEKVVLLVKHPDKEDNLEISKTRYVKGDKIQTSGLWFNKDQDGNIPKNSALAHTMMKYGVDVLDNFTGKEVQTELDNGYIVVKAY